MSPVVTCDRREVSSGDFKPALQFQTFCCAPPLAVTRPPPKIRSSVQSALIGTEQNPSANVAKRRSICPMMNAATEAFCNSEAVPFRASRRIDAGRTATLASPAKRIFRHYVKDAQRLFRQPPIIDTVRASVEPSCLSMTMFYFAAGKLRVADYDFRIELNGNRLASDKRVSPICKASLLNSPRRADCRSTARSVQCLAILL